MITPFEAALPSLHRAIVETNGADLEQVLPGATEGEIAAIEAEVRVTLPESYRQLLRCARGFWLFGGAIQFGGRHPFYHEFPPLSALTPQQQQVVKRKGGAWPPPSDGMLCIAEFFLEADGDQVLWDVSTRRHDGEYPIFYYAHEARPPSVRKVADSFPVFLDKMVAMFDER